MPRCIIDNCPSVYDNIKERRQFFFNAPKDQSTLQLWQSVINRPNFVVKPHHVVCEKHFRKEDIMWRREIKDQNGVVIGVSPYKLPRLRKGVLPSLYLGNSQNDLRICLDQQPKPLSLLPIFHTDESERPISRNSENEVITVQPDLAYSDYSTESNKPDISPKKESLQNSEGTMMRPTEPEVQKHQELTLEDLLRNDSLLIPASWIKYSLSNNKESVLVFNENICRTTENGLKTVVMKEIIVDEQLCVHVNVLNERIDVNQLGCAIKINKIDDLQGVVNLVYKLDICKGYCTPKNIDYTAIYVDPLNTYRHVKCLLLVMNEARCKFCCE